MRRVAVTGLGCITAAGPNLATTWEAVTSGRSGIERVAGWDVSEWPHPLAGEIKDYQPRRLIADRKLLKMITRQDVLGLNAVTQALEHSRIVTHRDDGDDPERFNERTGVFVASPGNKYRHQHDYLGSLAAAKGDAGAFNSGAMDDVHPMWLLRTLPNNVLAYAGIQYGFKGSNENVIAHAVGGIQAIAEACRYIRDGAIDRAVVVGYDSACEPEALVYYGAMGLLSASGLRPYDRDRDGTVLGEGAGALVLEAMEEAQAREATIYGEVLASAVVSEAEGILSVRDDGDGLARAVQSSLERSALPAGEVGMISGHANGTEHSDASEARALVGLFGAETVPVTGFKWSVGHTIAASGVIESMLTLVCLREGLVPGIATLDNPARECKGLGVSSSAQEPRTKKGLVVSRGFAGLNASLVLSTDVA
jgi:3-oxoacyl-[acyl-carrier-protein] synthase-1